MSIVGGTLPPVQPATATILTSSDINGATSSIATSTSKPQDDQVKSASDGASTSASTSAPTTAAPTSAPSGAPAAAPPSAAHHHVDPKPVEVMSVPETPVASGTPAGGTPRPELIIPEEPPKESTTQPKEADVILGPRDPAAAPKQTSPPEPVTDDHVPNGDTVMATAIHSGPVTGEKRKAEDEEEHTATEKPAEPAPTPAAGLGASTAPSAANGDSAPAASAQEDHSPEKKQKLTDKIAEKVTEVKDKFEEKTTGGKGKPGRPKKDKKAPAPVGRTERKTRSQGPAA